MGSNRSAGIILFANCVRLYLTRGGGGQGVVNIGDPLEIPLSLKHRRDGIDLRPCGLLVVPFIVHEEERLAALDRAAQSSTEIIEPIERNRCIRPDKKVLCKSRSELRMYS